MLFSFLFIYLSGSLIFLVGDRLTFIFSYWLTLKTSFGCEFIVCVVTKVWKTWSVFTYIDWCCHPFQMRNIHAENIWNFKLARMTYMSRKTRHKYPPKAILVFAFSLCQIIVQYPERSFDRFFHVFSRLLQILVNRICIISSIYIWRYSIQSDDSIPKTDAKVVSN